MKLYKAGAVLLAISTCVSSTPVSVIAADNTAGQMQNKAAKEITENSSNSSATDAKETDKENKNKTNTDQTTKSSVNRKDTKTDKTNKNNKDSLKNNQKKQNTKDTNKDDGKDEKEQENSEGETENSKEAILLTSIEDFQKIGTEGYPLDGKYILQNDIDGKNLETQQNSVIEPLLDGEEPFTGEIDGNGHTIANYNVARAEEGTRNTALFGTFGGTLENVQLLNIHASAKQNSTAIVAEHLNGAVLKNIMIAGTTELIPLETIEEQQQSTEEQQKIEEHQRNRQEVTIALYVDNRRWGISKTENNKKEEKTTKFENVKAVTGLSDLSKNVPEGITQIKTNPDYLSTTEGVEEEVEAPEIEGFQFKGWMTENMEQADKPFEGKIETPNELKTKIIGKEGKYRLKAAYQYDLFQNENMENSEQHTAEIAITDYYIVGKDINTIEKLKPIDNVFPKQISTIVYLDLIDGVFPKNMEVGKKTEGETINITSWEQFKNIGNTDYNSHYTMDANYVLNANIFSDGQLFTPIGTEEHPFEGSFDGNGFEINVSKNKEIDTNAAYNGLFGVVKSKV